MKTKQVKIKNKNTIHFPYHKISKQQKEMKYKEWKWNPIKFIHECCIVSQVGGANNLLKLYEPQKHVVKTFYLKHYLIFCKSRQIGISMTLQCICVHMMIFFPNVFIGVASKDFAEASDFSRKVKDIINNIPYNWIKPKYTPGDNNKREFSLTNGSRLITGSVSPANPSGLFRGKTLNVFIMDECAFLPYADEAWTSVALSLSIGQEQAKNNGVPYGTAFISTPNKKTGRGKFYYDMWKSSNQNPNAVFIPIKIHWTEIEGRDQEWYDKQCALLDFKTHRIAQELDLKFVGDEDSVWNEKIQDILSEIKFEDIDYREEKLNIDNVDGKLYIFEEFDPEKFYFIASDVAGGSSFDNSTIEVLEYKDMKQVAEFKGKVEPKKFAKVIEYIDNMYPNNIINIESNTFGAAVITELSDNRHKNFNLYGEYREQKNIQDPNSKSSFEIPFVLGTNTNSKTRPMILESVYNYVTEYIDNIKSPLLASELLSLVRKKGKIQAEEGCNDDLVMAMGLACYVRNYGIEQYSQSVLDLRKSLIKDVETKIYNQKESTVDNFSANIKLTKKKLKNTFNKEDSIIDSITDFMETEIPKPLKPNDIEQMYKTNINKLKLKYNNEKTKIIEKDDYLSDLELEDANYKSGIFNQIG